MSGHNVRSDTTLGIRNVRSDTTLGINNVTAKTREAPQMINGHRNSRGVNFDEYKRDTKSERSVGWKIRERQKLKRPGGILSKFSKKEI